MIIDLTSEDMIKKFKNRPDDHIFILDNMISDEQCDFLRNFIDAHAVKDETTVVHNTNVKAYVFDLSTSTNYSLFTNILSPVFNKVINLLHTRYFINVSGNFYNEILLRKIYGDTRLHIDGPKIDVRKKEHKVLRELAFILCLNDDYESGEIIFPSQNREIKLKKGQVLLFPPYWTHPHYTNAPKNDTFRYTVTTWLCE